MGSGVIFGGQSSMRRTSVLVSFAVAAVTLVGTADGLAQRGQGPAAPPPTARAAAAIDLAGTGVSVVTEDWVVRMLTPPQVQVRGGPLTPAAQKSVAGWDPGKDEAAGEQCKAYGAPAVTRMPGRMRINWQDDYTLRWKWRRGTRRGCFIS